MKSRTERDALNRERDMATRLAAIAEAIDLDSGRIQAAADAMRLEISDNLAPHVVQLDAMVLAHRKWLESLQDLRDRGLLDSTISGLRADLGRED